MVYNTVNEQRWRRGVSGTVMLRRTSRTSHRPHASRTSPLGTCSINCCLYRACRLHTHHLLLASKKPHTELYEIFIQCVHFSSLPTPPLFLPIPIPHLGPPLAFKLRHQTDKKDFSLPCFSARLPSCPEALEYLVSSLAVNITPLCARSKNLIGGT